MNSFGNGTYKRERSYAERQKNSNKYVCVKAKKICRIKYDEICQCCGRPNSKDAHHIDFDETNNNQNNLICLCRSCHERIHLGIIKRVDGYYIVDREVAFTQAVDRNNCKDYLRQYMEITGRQLFKSTNGYYWIAVDNRNHRLSVKEIKEVVNKHKEELLNLKEAQLENVVDLLDIKEV